jgi:YesN/AraC family two-component response regulator
MYRVMIVDDEPLIREGMRTLIEWEYYGFKVVAVARDGNDALAQYDDAAPDLMIIDIRMPVMDGLQLIEAVRKQNNRTHYLILSGYSDFDYAKRAIHSKVDGYILKPVDEDELVQYMMMIRTQLDKEFADDPHDDRRSSRDFFGKEVQFGATTLKAESIDLTPYIDKLYFALDIGNKESASLLLQQIGNDIVKTDISEQLIKTQYVQLFVTVIHKLLQGHLTLKSSEHEFTEWIARIYKQTTFMTMQIFIDSQLSVIMDRIGLNNPHTLVKRMADMIQRNYSENLKLESLAEVFNYNSAYLGKLFKNHTGENFNTYLDRVRINKAKELLDQGLKVYQVAELVGYTNVDYFHTKFKKYVGKAPKAYQNE